MQEELLRTVLVTKRTSVAEQGLDIDDLEDGKHEVSQIMLFQLDDSSQILIFPALCLLFPSADAPYATVEAE